MKLPQPIVFAFISYFLYASQAVVLERKLSSFSPGAVLLAVYAVIVPLLLGRLLLMKTGNGTISWPTGVLPWIILAGIVFFFADYFMVKAYTSAFEGGGEYLFEIVAVGALFPVFAAMIKYAWVQSLPNRWHVAAFAVAGLVVWLAAKGNSFEQARQVAAAPPTASDSTGTP